jgi:hypothetical protein
MQHYAPLLFLISICSSLALFSCKKEDCPFYLEGYPSGSAEGNRYDGEYLANFSMLACLDDWGKKPRCADPEMPAETKAGACPTARCCRLNGKTLCDPSATGKIKFVARDISGSFVITRTDDYGATWDGHWMAYFGTLKGNIDDDGQFDVGTDGECCTDSYSDTTPLVTFRLSGHIGPDGHFEGMLREHVGMTSCDEACFAWTLYSGQRIDK